MTGTLSWAYAISALCACVALFANTGAAQGQQAALPVQEGEASPPPPPPPERNPLRITPPLPPHPGKVETPDWSAQEIEEAMTRCDMMLTGAGAVYRHLDPLREGRCGAPAPIELSSVGTTPPVRIEPPARVTCGLAATLSAWSDTILQKAAEDHLDETITGIRNVASYVCRNRYNSSDKPISEHARANALDMAAFRTTSGTWISVLDNWALPAVEPENTQEGAPAATEHEKVSGVTRSATETVAVPSSTPAPEPEPDVADEKAEIKPETNFLRDIHQGACTLFGTVLGPEANESHKDHFHYDLAERKHGNFCE